MLKKKNGFTLVELLAVIVILAIILAIAIPAITGLVANTRESAFESNVKMLIKGIDYKLLEQPGSVTTGNQLASIADFGGDPAQYDYFYVEELTPAIKISVRTTANSKFAGLCAVDSTFGTVTIHGANSTECNNIDQ